MPIMFMYLSQWTQHQVELGNAQQLLGIVLGEEFEGGGTLWKYVYVCIDPRVCLKGAVKGDLIIPSGFRKSEPTAMPTEKQLNERN